MKAEEAFLAAIDYDLIVGPGTFAGFVHRLALLQGQGGQVIAWRLEDGLVVGEEEEGEVAGGRS